jgi:hypothetical protein
MPPAKYTDPPDVHPYGDIKVEPWEITDLANSLGTCQLVCLGIILKCNFSSDSVERALVTIAKKRETVEASQ